MPNRQPIVAILGHVDHGKTTLLDYIRKTHRAAKELGGITQSIGAYEAEFNNKKLTFIDTPGHAAFRQMRSRGVATADIAVLVVAGDDGVKPQTLESIKYIREASIPFVVAITKADKPGISLDLVKAGLTQAEVFVEGYGGNTPVVSVSGKTGEGVATLLENISLLAELEDLPYNEDSPLEAPIIESQKDSRQGISVSAIVKAGLLKIGSLLFTETARGKVRALANDSGQPVKELKPGEPGKILGFETLPKVGEVVRDTKPEPLTTPSLDSGPASPTPTNKLNIILRTDSAGSLEAITASLTDEVKLIFEGIGELGESDILLARSTGALVLGFAVKAPSSVLKLAQVEGVTVKTFGIIYELLEYLEKKVMKILEPTIDEEELGRATILKIFEINKDKIAGCRLDSGTVCVGDTVHVKRGELTKEARVRGMRIGKTEVKQASIGSECGILFSTNLDIEPKDIIISYKKIKTEED